MLLPIKIYRIQLKHGVKTIVLISTLCVSLTALAATPLSQMDATLSQRSAEQAPNTLHANVSRSQNTLSQRVTQFLGAQEFLTFRDITPSHVSQGIKHLQQTINGTDIDDAIIAVRFDSVGNIEKIYGQVFDDVQADIKAQAAQKTNSINQLQVAQKAVDAKAIAQSHLQTLADFGRWEMSQWSRKSTIRVIDGKAQQVIRVSFFAENKSAHEVTRPQIFISPITGEILEASETLNRDMQAGSGDSGNEMTGLETYQWVDHATDALAAGTFLVNYSDGLCTMELSANNGTWKNNIRIKNGSNPSNAYTYPCDTQGNSTGGSQYFKGAFSPLNDASFNAQVAYNLYENFAITRYFGPLGSVNKTLEVRVNYAESDNAFWNGEFVGLGTGVRYFYPKVSADTLGHEIGHAFLENYSQINQSAGISMGIAESFADIAGEATEYAIREKSGQQNDWKYGADTYKPTLVEAARYFEFPTTDGKSIDSAKDLNYEVVGHHLAGPMNKAYFHLVNDNADWDPIIGFDLWITAAANYWTPSMLYEDAAEGILDSVNHFRFNNTRLPSSWSRDDIRYAVIRAFAKSDIMVRSTDLTVALFDYKRSFDSIVLTNHTSSKSEITPNYSWDINNDGQVEKTTLSLSETVTVTPEANADSVTIKLNASHGDTSDNYIRELDLAPEYCKPSGSGGSADYIKQIGLNGEFYAASGSEVGGYGDYTTLPPLALSISATNSFTLIPNDSSFTRQWVIYVDLNGDHDFDDEGEKLGTKSGKGKVSLSVTLSGLTNALNGKVTRMRVITDWASMERPCAFASSGEYEDYLVTLTTDGVDPDPDPDANPIVSFSIDSSIGNTKANFQDTSTDVPAEVTWLWQYRLEGGTTYTDISTDQHTNYDFLSFGRYVVKLTITLKDGKKFSEERRLVLKDNDSKQPTYCNAGNAHSGTYINRLGIRHSGGSWNVIYNNSGAPSTPDGYTFFDLSKNKGPISSADRNWVYLNVNSRSYVRAWIDKGRDGQFDSEDLILEEDVLNTKYTMFQLGEGYLADEPYRLRLVLRSDQFGGPCDELDDSNIQGEVEDYTVFVQ